jgi:hypothetical protein
MLSFHPIILLRALRTGYDNHPARRKATVRVTIIDGSERKKIRKNPVASDRAITSTIAIIKGSSSVLSRASTNQKIATKATIGTITGYDVSMKAASSTIPQF